MRFKGEEIHVRGVGVRESGRQTFGVIAATNNSTPWINLVMAFILFQGKMMFRQSKQYASLQ